MSSKDPPMEAYERLRAILKELNRVCIAYSGGVDSNLLLHAAVRALGPGNVLATTAVSGTYTASELEQAIRVSSSLGVEHIILNTNELDDPLFRANPPDRCYICRGTFLSKLVPIAVEKGFPVICDGSNMDDLSDHRPGRKAAKEAGVRSPLIETGIDKETVRSISRELGIGGWDRPSSPCLASRVPYGEEITLEKLKAIEKGESFLAELGFRGARVRHHGQIVRIEIGPELIAKASDPKVREKMVSKMKELGFKYVCLDLEGYRTGSLNKTLGFERVDD